MIKVLTVAGIGYEDMVVFLARAFMALGDRVCIQDMTAAHPLSAFIPQIDGHEPSEDLVEYAGIFYTYKDVVDEDALENEEKCSLIIRLHDLSLRTEDDNDALLYIVDEHRSTMEILERLTAASPMLTSSEESEDEPEQNNNSTAPVSEGESVEESRHMLLSRFSKNAGSYESDGCYLVVREYVGASEPFTKFMLTAKVGSLVRLPFSENDRHVRLLFENYGSLKFKGISNEYAGFIREVMEYTHKDVPPKKIKKAYARAASGRIQSVNK